MLLPERYTRKAIQRALLANISRKPKYKAKNKAVATMIAFLIKRVSVIPIRIPSYKKATQPHKGMKSVHTI